MWLGVQHGPCAWLELAEEKGIEVWVFGDVGFSKLFEAELVAAKLGIVKMLFGRSKI